MSYVGIDIGATWTRIAISDSNGNILAKKKIRTLLEHENERDMLRRLQITINDLLDSIDAKHVEAIGVGSIGPLDIRRGIILRTPNLPLESIPIGPYLRKAFNAPTYVVNDCTAAVIGEKFFGAGRKSDNIVYITLSSGIGGGAIVDGNVLFGKDGNAVEIGHIVVDYLGNLRCGCGGYGHWEAYTSGKNVGKFVKFLVEKKYGSKAYRESILSKYSPSPDRLNYPQIIAAVSKKDSLALSIMEDIAKINAAGFAGVINAYDPEVISVGGSIVLRNPPELILDPVRKKLKSLIINREPKILVTPLGDDVVLLGAVAIATNPNIIPKKFRDEQHASLC